MTPNDGQESRSLEPANKGGAPLGSMNGIRTGARSDAVRNVKLGSLPDKRIERDCNRFRRVVEQWTLDRHGVIRPRHELAINSAVRHEVVCRMALRYLKLHEADLPPAEKLSYLSLVAKHSDLRDKSVDRLDLELDARSQFANMYGLALGGTDG